MTSKRVARSSDPIPSDRLFLSVPEVSALLGLDSDGRSVRKAIAAGEIPGFKVGPQWHVPVAWVRERARLGATADGGPEAA